MPELTNASGIEIPEALTCSINDSSWCWIIRLALRRVPIKLNNIYLIVEPAAQPFGDISLAAVVSHIQSPPDRTN